MPRTISTPGDNSALGNDSVNFAADLETGAAPAVQPTRVERSDTDFSASAPQLKTTPILAGTAEQQMAALMAQMAEMQAKLNDVSTQNAMLVKQVNRAAPVVEPPEKLPTVDEAIAMDADKPVLTVEGWHVPRVTTANPEQKRG